MEIIIIRGQDIPLKIYRQILIYHITTHMMIDYNLTTILKKDIGNIRIDQLLRTPGSSYLVFVMSFL